MFHQSGITPKCSCGVPETICKTHGFKRFLLPAGNYGPYWQDAGYYSAEWMTLECERCKTRREDFHVWKWHSNGDLTFVDGIFQTDERRRYPDVYKAIRAMLPE